MTPTMHDLLDLYPDVLAERRSRSDLPRTRPVKFRPVPFRPLAPEHGHYAARLWVPTRRQRFLAWWWGRRQWQRDALLTAVAVLAILAFAAAVVLLGVLVFGLARGWFDALADWVDQL